MIVITFYTHHSAMTTHRSLKNNKIDCKMAPVPRSLSSSCGSCVIAYCDELDFSLIDDDFEAVYKQVGADFEKLLSNE